MDSEDDSQFLNNDFSYKVKEYVVLDEKIKSLTGLMRERKERKKELQKDIKQVMSASQIDYLNTNTGILSYTQNERITPITKKMYSEAVEIYFMDKQDEKVKFIEILNNMRQKVVSSSISLKKN
jgi:hypothetical protein